MNLKLLPGIVTQMSLTHHVPQHLKEGHMVRHIVDIRQNRIGQVAVLLQIMRPGRLRFVSRICRIIHVLIAEIGRLSTTHLQSLAEEGSKKRTRSRTGKNKVKKQRVSERKKN